MWAASDTTCRCRSRRSTWSANLASPSSLRIHTHVREDVIALYGFATPLEHDVFERLIGISGIGPKLALAVLSGIEPAELIKAVRQQDVAQADGDPRESGRRRRSGSAWS